MRPRVGGNLRMLLIGLRRRLAFGEGVSDEAISGRKWKERTMCGIVGFVGESDAAPSVLRAPRKLQ